METKNELEIFKNENFGQVKVIKDEKGEPLFELYSVGSALGYSKSNSIGKYYPRKDRIDQTVLNADIKPCVQSGHKYLTEDMLYDFIFEAKTEKSKPFRKWVTGEVLPTLRRKGYYNLHNEEESKLEQKAIKLFDELNEKTGELGEYFRPKHKTKLALNKFIKDCLGDNATKENCKKAKDMLIIILGNGEYTIYEDIPLEKIKSSNTIAILYDICKNINNSIVGGIR